MFAGKLDRRLTLLRASKGRNAANGVTTTYAPFAEVWASRRFVRAAKKVQAAQQGVTVVWTFEIRHSSEVAEIEKVEGYRCEHDGTVYSIWDVEELGRRDGFAITVAGLPKGAVA